MDNDKKVRGEITQVMDGCSKSDVGVGTDEFLRIDVACGNNKKSGFIGLDISEYTQCDWICNLNYYPWQYKEIVSRIGGGTQYRELRMIEDNTVGEVFCSHYIEHVKDLRKFAQELYRICRPGAIVTFHAPYYSSIRAMQDPTHVNFISEATFLYWDAEWMKVNKLEHYNMGVNFKSISGKYVYDPEWNTRSSAAREYARRHYINVVSDIEMTLQVVK
jgi:SAM-dependent methyltransferase